jgi:hypothetical protein
VEDNAYAIDAALLHFGRARRESEAESENDREPDQPHWHSVGNRCRGV